MSPPCWWMGTGAGWGGDGSSTVSRRGGHGTGMLIAGLSRLQVTSSKSTPKQGSEMAQRPQRVRVRGAHPLPVPCPQLLPHGEGSTHDLVARGTRWVLPALFVTRSSSLSSPPGAPSSRLFPPGASNHTETPLDGARWPDASVMPAEPGRRGRASSCPTSRDAPPPAPSALIPL